MKIYIIKDCIHQGIHVIDNARMYRFKDGTLAYMARHGIYYQGCDFVLTKSMALKAFEIRKDAYIRKLAKEFNASYEIEPKFISDGPN